MSLLHEQGFVVVAEVLPAALEAASVGHRRIVHVEFAAAPLPGAARFRACVR